LYTKIQKESIEIPRENVSNIKPLLFSCRILLIPVTFYHCKHLTPFNIFLNP